MAQKNGKKTDLKKLTRLVTVAVFAAGFTMIGFAAWFIWRTLEGVSNADLGRRSTGTKVEGINMTLLDGLRADADAKVSADRKLPDKIKDPFAVPPSAPSSPAATPAEPTPPPAAVAPTPPPPGTPPADQPPSSGTPSLPAVKQPPKLK